MTWLPAAKTRFFIGKLKNSGILAPFQLESSKGPLHVEELLKDIFHLSEWCSFLCTESLHWCVNVEAQFSKPQTSFAAP